MVLQSVICGNNEDGRRGEIVGLQIVEFMGVRLRPSGI